MTVLQHVKVGLLSMELDVLLNQRRCFITDDYNNCISNSQGKFKPDHISVLHGVDTDDIVVQNVYLNEGCTATQFGSLKTLALVNLKQYICTCEAITLGSNVYNFFGGSITCIHLTHFMTFGEILKEVLPKPFAFGEI